MVHLTVPFIILFMIFMLMFLLMIPLMDPLILSGYANILVNGWRHKNCVQAERGGGGGLSKILKILRPYFMDGPLKDCNNVYIIYVWPCLERVQSNKLPSLADK